MKPVDTVAGINTNSLIESQLEQRFIDALKALPGARMTPQLVRGSNGHLLSFTAEQGGSPVSWLVEHQVYAGPDDGASIDTRIDVVIRPARAKDAERLLPIAVYTDGLQYHHDRVADDVCKRMSLLRSGRYHVFSLGWDDIPAPGKPAQPVTPDLVVQPALNPGLVAVWNQLAEQESLDAAAAQQNAARGGSFTQLEAYLRDPHAWLENARQVALFFSLTRLEPEQAKDAPLRHAFHEELGRMVPQAQLDVLAVDDATRLFGGHASVLGNALPGLSMVTTFSVDNALAPSRLKLEDDLVTALCLDDLSSELNDAFKAAWRGFWRAANLLQFLPRFGISTARAVADGRLETLWRETASVSVPAPSASSAPRWEDMEFCALDAATLEALHALGLPQPEVGADIVGPNGEVLLGGEFVELSWPDEQVAVLGTSPAAGDPALPSWHLLVEGDALLAGIRTLQEKGVWS